MYYAKILNWISSGMKLSRAGRIDKGLGAIMHDFKKVLPTGIMWVLSIDGHS